MSQRAQIGADAYPDLLYLSLSATDLVGHTLGPDSRKLLDRLLRLDRPLGDVLRLIEDSADRIRRRASDVVRDLG